MADISSSNRSASSSTTSVVFHEGSKTAVPKEATISWIVEDMKDKMTKFQPGEFIKTGTFAIEDSKWYFIIYPNGRTLNRKGYISLGLVSDNDKKLLAKCNFKGGKSDHGWFKIIDKRSMKGAETFKKIGSYYGFQKFLSHELVMKNENRVISRGRMEFEMKVTLVEDGETNPPANLMEETSEINRLRRLSDNFANLLWDETTSDFYIVCGGEKFPVHRIVLKARSIFFSGLFSNDYAETKTGHISMEGIDRDTVKILIEYIYTGRLNDLESNAVHLLRVANMYDFPLLKKSCEDQLISTVNVENAVDLFVLAEDHEASELRAAAKKIILEHKRDIVKQDGWDAKLGTLVIELFKEL